MSSTIETLFRAGSLVIAATTVVACGGPIASGDAGCPDGAPLWVCRSLDSGTEPDATTVVDAATPDGSACPQPSDASVADGDYVPFIAGEYFRAYTPEGTNYLNDHTLFRDPSTCRWNLVGITAETLGTPSQETAFIHATADNLLGPWTQDSRPALEVDATLDESLLWAPYVFENPAGHLTMLYEGGWRGAPPPREIRRADFVTDHWVRQESGTGIDAAHRVPGGRDPFALHLATGWLVYSVGVRQTAAGNYGQIVVTSIADLDNPTNVANASMSIAIEDPAPVANPFNWGNLESPFVVPFGGKFYLFLTRTGIGHTDYVRTLVFRSTDPAHFEWDPITVILSHAAEIVRDRDRWFITSAGWTSEVGEANRGLLIAPLAWAQK